MFTNLSSKAPPAQFTLHICNQDASDRLEVERFIADQFAHKLQAQIQVFMPTLLVVRNQADSIVAACGVRSGLESQFFLEHYLDGAVEHVINQLGHTEPVAVSRKDVAEIGNLASVSYRASRFLFKSLYEYCSRKNVAWVAFTSCQRLIRSFQHLGLPLTQIAEARMSCLGEQAGTWGSYYADKPTVMVGRLQNAKSVFVTHSANTTRP